VPGPAYRIVTERLVVRCWEPDDAALLKEAVDSSLEHLLPWMPWAADEPQTVEQKVSLLRHFRGRFDEGEDFVYGILDPSEERVLGGSGLHPRGGKDMREIGYWVRADAQGKGLIGEATAALTRVAFELEGVDRVEIPCDPTHQPTGEAPRWPSGPASSSRPRYAVA
jgi:RimJ/RimL family protein N-acetyltransferase